MNSCTRKPVEIQAFDFRSFGLYIKLNRSDKYIIIFIENLKITYC